VNSLSVTPIKKGQEGFVYLNFAAALTTYRWHHSALFQY